MLKYKQDIISSLKKAGYSSAKLRKDKIFGEATLTFFRRGDTAISCRVIDRLCQLLDCQPGDLLEYVPDDQGSDPGGDQSPN